MYDVYGKDGLVEGGGRGAGFAPGFQFHFMNPNDLFRQFFGSSFSSFGGSTDAHTHAHTHAHNQAHMHKYVVVLLKLTYVQMSPANKDCGE